MIIIFSLDIQIEFAVDGSKLWRFSLQRDRGETMDGAEEKMRTVQAASERLMTKVISE